MLQRSAVRICGTEIDDGVICFIGEQDGGRKIMGGVDGLDLGNPIANDIEILVAAATTEEVCACIRLLRRSKGIEFFFSNFAFQHLFNQIRPFLT